MRLGRQGNGSTYALRLGTNPDLLSGEHRKEMHEEWQSAASIHAREAYSRHWQGDRSHTGMHKRVKWPVIRGMGMWGMI